MAEASKPRAVSGEIMTDRPESAAGSSRPDGDIIDAEFIVLLRAGSRSPGSPRSPGFGLSTPGPSIGSAAVPSGGMDVLRRQDAPAEPCKPARGGPLFWSIGIGLALAAFWISGGHALVRGIPFAAPGEARSALHISGVTSRIDVAGARALLFVDGEAANDGDAVEHLPALEIAVTGNDGHITRYRLGTSGRPLSSGETFAFSSRLDMPKNGVKTVSVAFAE
jgi:hypothetical protein